MEKHHGRRLEGRFRGEGPEVAGGPPNPPPRRLPRRASPTQRGFAQQAARSGPARSCHDWRVGAGAPSRPSRSPPEVDKYPLRTESAVGRFQKRTESRAFLRGRNPTLIGPRASGWGIDCRWGSPGCRACSGGFGRPSALAGSPTPPRDDALSAACPRPAEDRPSPSPSPPSGPGRRGRSGRGGSRSGSARCCPRRGGTRPRRSGRRAGP